MARASQGQSVLSKHLRILAAFEAAVPFLSLSEIAARAGLAPSSTHRLVAELEAEGLLERLPDRTYRLGVRLWELACRTPGALGLRELARPHLHAVHARVRQHVQLGVLSGTEVVFLDRLSVKDAVVNATLIGGRIPLHASSSGLVLLAYAGQELVDEVLSHPLRRYTPHTIASERQLRAALRRVRADGWAVSDGHIHEDSRGIAVPVYGAHRDVIAAISVVVANDDTPPLPHIELLTRAARAISADLRGAYLPTGHPAATPGGRFRPLVTSSVRSMEYLESLSPTAAGDGAAHNAPVSAPPVG
ncbi:IclR family transcriptional regulator [Microbacterium rhizomatis]|uniref:IclR family transcriptional regulator n=1 Tax=Microbacterium rhizomatis TaxID=1631477 RepID=A0A5J5J4R2_9MICO|nr:IclR family transcriptional regulator [Microbacterium rhizomatis]KAA9108323.1 IclR family transcriptional regulator [Microbacterium rhizomatis]